MSRKYKYPKIVSQLQNTLPELWLVGSTAAHGVREDRDIDLVVPLAYWYRVASLLPLQELGAWANTFGGWSFHSEEGYKIDIWPDEIGRIMTIPIGSRVFIELVSGTRLEKPSLEWPGLERSSDA